jgi:hypothetical protein
MQVSKYRFHYFCLILTCIVIRLQVLMKLDSTEFHEFPFDGSPIVSCGIQSDGRRNESIVAFLHITVFNMEK